MSPFGDTSKPYLSRIVDTPENLPIFKSIYLTLNGRDISILEAQIKYCHPIYYRYDPARFISDVRQNFMLFR